MVPLALGKSGAPQEFQASRRGKDASNWFFLSWLETTTTVPQTELAILTEGYAPGKQPSMQE
jgi:hypothetical protein